MKAASLARPLLRSPALRTAAARRLESTAASKATDAAKDTVSRAQQGLSRVASAAGPAIAGAAKGVGNVLGKMGGRTGRLVGFIERKCWECRTGHLATLDSSLLWPAHAQQMENPNR